MEMKRQLENPDVRPHTPVMSYRNSNYCSAEQEKSTRRKTSSPDTSSHNGPAGARRQSAADGSVYEKQSLLESSCEENTSPTHKIPNDLKTRKNSLQGNAKLRKLSDVLELREFNTNDSSNQGSHVPRKHSFRRHSCAEMNTSDTSLTNSRKTKLSDVEPNRKKRIQVLQNQLTKIRTEIEALGDIEIEITHV